MMNMMGMNVCKVCGVARFEGLPHACAGAPPPPPNRPTYVGPLPGGAKVVSLVVHHDIVFVATERGVYRMDGDRLVEIPFEQGPK